jgi:hypothetical protein
MRSSTAEFPRSDAGTKVRVLGLGRASHRSVLARGRFCRGVRTQPALSPSYCHIDQSNAALPHKNTFNPRRPHGRHDSMGECIEIQIDLLACGRCCCSARRLERQGRGPERCRIGLFHGKRVADRERRAVESGRVDRRPSFIPVRIQDSSHQSPQWTLRSGHGQRSRPVCSRPHYRYNAGCRSSARFFRACAGYGRAGIGENPQEPAFAMRRTMKLGRFLLPVNRKPPEPDGSPLRNSVLWSGRHGDRRAVASPL